MAVRLLLNNLRPPTPWAEEDGLNAARGPTFQDDVFRWDKKPSVPLLLECPQNPCQEKFRGVKAEGDEPKLVVLEELPLSSLRK